MLNPEALYKIQQAMERQAQVRKLTKEDVVNVLDSLADSCRSQGLFAHDSEFRAIENSIRSLSEAITDG